MPAAASVSGPPPSRESDEEHIVHALIAVARAFATFNADAVRTAYAPDADCIDADGNAVHGRDAIVDHLRRVFAVPHLGPASLVTPPTLTLRWLGDDVVIATTYLERRGEPPRRSHSLKVLTRGDEETWLIVADIYADARGGASLRNTPLRWVPICPQPSVRGGRRRGRPPVLELEAELLARAADRGHRRRDLAQERRRVGGRNLGRRGRGARPDALARQSTVKSTRAGVSFGPKNWNVSITGKLRTRSTARRFDILKSIAVLCTSSVQNRPDGRMPPLKSCSCSPELGSKRSIQTKANEPR